MTLAHDVAPEVWTATRAEGLRRLQAFVPRAGRAYAERRNHDLGPGDRSNVSVLSPWIRHRLITEQEVVAATLERHALRTAEKFVQEVCWRTYWKGWLEMRPAVWRDYRARLVELVAELERDPGLRARYETACAGRTGIACFDAWVGELVDGGYLHNHARMWFASVWIFTLRLPWELGADLFLRHLLDGDPASNTLSWRWVGGLHTRGKTYLARAANIAKYTGGRFPVARGLADTAPPLDGPPPPAPRPLPPADRAEADGPVGLLLTEEDLHPESLPMGSLAVAAVAALGCTGDRSPFAVGAPATAFADGALRDGLARAGAAFGAPAERLDDADWGTAALDWAQAHDLRILATAHAPVGPAAGRLHALQPRLAEAGIRMIRLRRAWDDGFWPHATKGFFGLKARIPEVLATLGVGAAGSR